MNKKKGYSVYVCSLFFLYGDHANIILRVPFSIGWGKFVQNFVPEQRWVLVCIMFLIHSLSMRLLFHLCFLHSIPFGVTSVPRSCNRTINARKKNMHSIPAEYCRVWTKHWTHTERTWSFLAVTLLSQFSFVTFGTQVILRCFGGRSFFSLYTLYRCLAGAMCMFGV